MVASLVDDCERCAKVYDDDPGPADPAAISDLYRGIARLALIVKLHDSLRQMPAAQIK